MGDHPEACGILQGKGIQMKSIYEAMRSKRFTGWIILRNGWPMVFSTGQRYFPSRAVAETVVRWLQ